MIALSYSEAYLLSIISASKKVIKIKHFSEALLGLYVCDFLDLLEKKKGGFQKHLNVYFLNPNNVWNKKNTVFPILEKLRLSKLIDVKKTKLFNHFSLITYFNKKKSPLKTFRFENLNEFIFQSLEKYKILENSEKVKEIIKLFNEKLFSLFQSYEYEASTYELRFFWPNTRTPKVYNVIKSIFEKNEYKKETNKDKYVIKADNLIIKLRKNQIFIKKSIKDFFNVRFFSKKQKIKLPFKKAFLEHIDEKVIIVEKERNIRGIGSHSKIEFSLIKIQGKKWKTICVESTHIQNVLALSFLINQEHSEKLTYNEFLNKFISEKLAKKNLNFFN